MGYAVIFHPIAEKELTDAFLWYEQRLDGLGDRFVKAVEKSISQISSTPLAYAKKHHNYREVKPQDFPYVIVYKIQEKRKIVFIAAVYHTSRNPRKKYRK
jgi:mRNA-degrading endonuclease RelE of RelBE toxin-antitoxin system